MARVIAIVNQKGGVGKTTTAINLGAGLALCEQRTLLLDLDPQANSTRGLGYASDPSRPSIYDVLVGDHPLSDILLPTQIDRLTLAPSEPDLIGFEVEFMASERREGRLREALFNAGSFDFILIDCPPSLGLLTVNGLVAAKRVLVPVQCEYLALEGVTLLMETLRRVTEALNRDLQVHGILLTMYDERTNLSRQVVEDIREFFHEMAYTTVIPRSVRLSEAPSFGKPIFLYDPRSRGAEAYFNLAKEILQRDMTEAKATSSLGSGTSSMSPLVGPGAESSAPGLSDEMLFGENLEAETPVDVIPDKFAREAGKEREKDIQNAAGLAVDDPRVDS